LSPLIEFLYAIHAVILLYHNDMYFAVYGDSGD